MDTPEKSWRVRKKKESDMIMFLNAPKALKVLLETGIKPFFKSGVYGQKP